MYKVSVVMSTYNGQKYLKEQIDSILNQKDVNVNLYIRDDHSSDDTISLLAEYAEDYPNVSFCKGENKGFANSFLQALKDCPEADFYAFSDQDDVWDKKKLITCINVLVKGNFSLVCSNMLTCDEKLNPIAPYYRQSWNSPYKGMSFLLPVGHGMSMVFNNKIRRYAIRVQEQIPISHDLFLGAIASYMGEVGFIHKPLSLYRRLNNSLSRKRPLKMLTHRIGSLFIDRGVNQICANIFLEYYGHELDDESAKLLVAIATYKRNLKSKLSLIKNPRMAYPGLFGWIIIKTKILFNRF